jgi:hypothetical protein
MATLICIRVLLVHTYLHTYLHTWNISRRKSHYPAILLTLSADKKKDRHVFFRGVLFGVAFGNAIFLSDNICSYLVNN